MPSSAWSRRCLILGSALLCCWQITWESAGAWPARSPFRLMSAQRDQQYRDRLPAVDDPQLVRILADPALMLYTEVEMPQAYQDWSSGLPGVHSPDYNVSAGRGEPHGNGNREFPWNAPAGTHRSSGVTSFRFLWLPRDENGRRRPLVWFRKQLRGASSTGYAWRYPVGAIFGEVLQLQGPSGTPYTFEMRIRIREEDAWGVDVFRPYPTAMDLARRIEKLRPDWETRADVAGLLKHLRQPRELPRQVLADPHPLVSFRQEMGVDRLPAVKPALVTELLTNVTFRSSLDATWRRGTEGQWTCAPTTDAKFHIVPARYDAGFIEVQRKSCMRCHRTVNHHVGEFQPARDWYGRIRGSDGIFSFHPFALDSIARNGMSRPVRMRQELITAGIVAPFDPRRHPPSIYTTLPQLGE